MGSLQGPLLTASLVPPDGSATVAQLSNQLGQATSPAETPFFICTLAQPSSQAADGQSGCFRLLRNLDSLKAHRKLDHHIEPSVDRKWWEECITWTDVEIQERVKEGNLTASGPLVDISKPPAGLSPARRPSSASSASPPKPSSLRPGVVNSPVLSVKALDNVNDTKKRSRSPSTTGTSLPDRPDLARLGSPSKTPFPPRNQFPNRPQPGYSNLPPRFNNMGMQRGPMQQQQPFVPYQQQQMPMNSQQPSPGMMGMNAMNVMAGGMDFRGGTNQQGMGQAWGMNAGGMGDMSMMGAGPQGWVGGGMEGVGGGGSMFPGGRNVGPGHMGMNNAGVDLMGVGGVSGGGMASFPQTPMGGGMNSQTPRQTSTPEFRDNTPYDIQLEANANPREPTQQNHNEMQMMMIRMMLMQQQQQAFQSQQQMRQGPGQEQFSPQGGDGHGYGGDGGNA